ncbi:Esterase EstB [Cyberlindnera fabianii]|uniref:Esterase EstB n=1 Tax=Cyberlindnera fabianii TaxID=36022 RepID=A0A1V2LBU0_CYBFA|nr:Esterase EstB [Cyberlindnera fabianii]
MSKISNKGIQEIKNILDDATSDPTTGVPGLFVSITNNKGDDLITYTSGYTGADATEKLSKDSIFWLASCTKLITTIAVLQLVEKGQLPLDDADQLDSILPELDSIQIATLNDDGNISLSSLRRIGSH